MNSSEKMVTVADLINILQHEDQDRVVVLSHDAEGNGFSPFTDFGRGTYVAESTSFGQLYNKQDEEDGVLPEGGVPALVLWPT